MPSLVSWITDGTDIVVVVVSSGASVVVVVVVSSGASVVVVVVVSSGASVVVVVEVEEVVVSVAGTVVSEPSSAELHAVAARAMAAHTSRYFFMITPCDGTGWPRQ
jgi:hypothetical protein